MSALFRAPSRAAWQALLLVALLTSCSGQGDRLASYTISIMTSRPKTPHAYAGSYQFFRDGERITRDLSNDGTYSVNFDAHRLVFVRVHGNDASSMYSLAISRDGEVVHQSPAVPANEPLIHYAPRKQ
jgi:hypothetical protein